MIRRLPQQGNPHSPLGGDASHSSARPVRRKISNAPSAREPGGDLRHRRQSARRRMTSCKPPCSAAVDRASPPRRKLAAAPDDEKPTLKT